MATVGQVVRFTAGMSMIAGGAMLVAPVVSDVVNRVNDHAAAAAATAEGREVADPSRHAIPDPQAEPVADVTGGFADSGVAQFVPSAEPYRPPAPPAPLPASFPGVVPAGTALDSTYRSTVQVPPPPLLDAHGPPPVAPGWSMREPARPMPAASRGQVPTTYIVQDGDDLTALAIRFYGHPGAAAAILAANADVLGRPDMLPIGASIRLPPPWTVSSAAASGGPPRIEPGPASARGSQSVGGRAVERGASPFSPVSTPRPWLDAGGT